MAVPDDRARLLRHPEPLDCGAVVGAADAVLWPDAAVLSALCVGRRGHRQANSAVDYARLRRQSDGLRAVVCERVLELEPNGPAVAFGRHANGLPLDAVAGRARQRDAPVAQPEHAADADILLGDRTGAVRQLHVRRRRCGLGQFSWYVSWGVSVTFTSFSRIFFFSQILFDLCQSLPLLLPRGASLLYWRYSSTALFAST